MILILSNYHISKTYNFNLKISFMKYSNLTETLNLSIFHVVREDKNRMRRERYCTIERLWPLHTI